MNRLGVWLCRVAGMVAQIWPRLRQVLDFVYTAAGVAAAVCVIAILLLIVIQMLARWTGEVFPGAPEYASYAMAAATFLAFANALNKGAHIRVSLLLNAVNPRVRRWIEVWCFSIATAIMWYFTWFCWRFVTLSYKINDISQGQDRTALWIPQTLMLAGAFILAVALIDHLLCLIFTGKHRIERATVGVAGRE